MSVSSVIKIFFKNDEAEYVSHLIQHVSINFKVLFSLMENLIEEVFLSHDTSLNIISRELSSNDISQIIEDFLRTIVYTNDQIYRLGESKFYQETSDALSQYYAKQTYYRKKDVWIKNGLLTYLESHSKKPQKLVFTEKGIFIAILIFLNKMSTSGPRIIHTYVIEILSDLIETFNGRYQINIKENFDNYLDLKLIDSKGDLTSFSNLICGLIVSLKFEKILLNNYTDNLNGIEHFKPRVIQHHDNFQDTLKTNFEMKSAFIKYLNRFKRRYGIFGLDIPNDMLGNLDESVNYSLDSELFIDTQIQEKDYSGNSKHLPVGYLELEKQILTSINNLSSDKNVIIMEGGPGLGKSSILRRLFLKLVNQTIRDLDNEESTIIFPIFIELKHLDKEEMERSVTLFFKFILEKYFTDYSKQHSEPLLKLFEQAVVEKNFVLILDGLDEVIDYDNRIEILQYVQNFLEDRVLPSPKLNLIISSRLIASVDLRMMFSMQFGGVLDIDIARFLHVFSIETSEVYRFINIWYMSYYKDDPTLGNKFIEGIIKDLEANQQAQELITSPLMVFLLVLHYDINDNLPLHYLELYDKFINAILYREHKTKSRKRYQGKILKIQHLQAIAYLLLSLDNLEDEIEENQRSLSFEGYRSLSEDEITGSLYKHLREKPENNDITHSDLKDEAKVISNLVLERARSIIKKSGGGYEFTIRPFTDYLITLELMDLIKKNRKSMELTLIDICNSFKLFSNNFEIGQMLISQYIRESNYEEPLPLEEEVLKTLIENFPSSSFIFFKIYMENLNSFSSSKIDLIFHFFEQFFTNTLMSIIPEYNLTLDEPNVINLIPSISTTAHGWNDIRKYIVPIHHIINFWPHYNENFTNRPLILKNIYYVRNKTIDLIGFLLREICNVKKIISKQSIVFLELILDILEFLVELFLADETIDLWENSNETSIDKAEFNNYLLNWFQLIYSGEKSLNNIDLILVQKSLLLANKFNRYFIDFTLDELKFDMKLFICQNISNILFWRDINIFHRDSEMYMIDPRILKINDKTTLDLFNKSGLQWISNQDFNASVFSHTTQQQILLRIQNEIHKKNIKIDLETRFVEFSNFPGRLLEAFSSDYRIVLAIFSGCTLKAHQFQLPPPELFQDKSFPYEKFIRNNIIELFTIQLILLEAIIQNLFSIRGLYNYSMDSLFRYSIFIDEINTFLAKIIPKYRIAGSMIENNPGTSYEYMINLEGLWNELRISKYWKNFTHHMETLFRE